MMTQKKERPPRITPEMVNDACNIMDISINYPFVRVFPITYPSPANSKLDWFFYNQKLNISKMIKLRKKMKNKNSNNIKKKKKRKKIDYLKLIRTETIKSAQKFMKLQNPNLCFSEECVINNVSCEWIKYIGSSHNNGVVLVIHGGGYVMGDKIMKYKQSELISSLTGYVCLLINYSLAPEYPLPQCINEIISVYKYLINIMNISPNKISMEGESAGGGAILLVLQKLKNELNIQLPCCVWVNSAWTDLSDSLPSKKRNNIYDAMLSSDKTQITNNYVVGNIDYFGKNTGKNTSLCDPIVSPLFGNWNGLCPIYFMCGATETLLDDTLYAAKKAYNSNVNIKVDIYPFMIHAGVVFANIPEYRDAIVRGCEWIMNNISNNNKKSKL